MVVDFGIEGIRVEAVRLPLLTHLFDEFKNHLPPSLNQAAEVRKNDFIAGRICAFKASAKLGVSLLALPIAEDRGPLWPHQLSGSISHSKKMAISCVARREEFFSLGIDAEEIISEQIDVAQQIASCNELSLVKDKLALTILFSAKEALYKAIYPLVKKYIDFKEVELTQIDFTQNTFSLRAVSKNLQDLGFDHFEGQFQIKDKTVITLIIIKKGKSLC